MLFPHPVILITVGAVASYLAKKRGRNPLLWFFLGMLFGIFGLVFLIFSRPAKKPVQTERDPSTIDITPNVEPNAKEKFWYYLDPDNTQRGPMSFDALSRALRQGEISAKTFVWNETLDNWKPLGDFM